MDKGEAKNFIRKQIIIRSEDRDKKASKSAENKESVEVEHSYIDFTFTNFMLKLEYLDQLKKGDTSASKEEFNNLALSEFVDKL